MKIAISTDGEYVSAHFGRCPSFTLADIEEGKLISKKVIDNPGHHPGYLPQFLSEKGVNCMVAGGMGMRAKELFKDVNIDIILGVEGKIDSIIDKIISDTLEGGRSFCKPGAGKGYGIDKTECEHDSEE
jgi:predicted Fe-Mo cluster-binding NifX family protein